MTTIKSIMLSLLAAMAFSSCAQTSIGEPVFQDNLYTYNFSLSIATKAVLGDDSIEYESGDALGVFVGSTMNSKSLVDVTTTPVTVGVKTASALEEGDMVYAYYPYSARNVSAQKTSVTLSIPATQSQTGSTYDADAMPMVSLPYQLDGPVQAGETEPVGRVCMNNLGAVAEFNIYGSDYTSETIKSVSFLSEGIGGSFLFDLTSVADEEDLVIERADAALVKTNVSQTLSVGVSKDSGAKVYMVLTPGAHKGVLTVTTSAASYAYDLNSAIQFNRSRVRPVNVNLANAQRTAEDVLTIIRNAGYNPDYYMPLEMDWTDLAYYYSSSKYSDIVTTAANSNTCICSQIFKKEEIPNGSLVVVTSGYQYRPEAWVELDQLNGANGNGIARPAMVTEQLLTVVDDAWWGEWNYRAFNISNSAKTSLVGATEAAHEAFAVFVPKLDTSTASLIDILVTAGYDPSDYTRIDVGYTDFAYYQSNTDYKSNLRTVASDGWNTIISDFVATRILTRAELPDGTLIVQKSGRQYRPEGWTDLDVKNSTRSDICTESIVTVDDSWWGSYIYRGFNLAFSPRVDLAESEDAPENLCGQVRDGFGIFVPNHPKKDAKTIKILAIGNSFSQDATEYLYGILKDVGYEKIILGHLYYAGCTLETHAGYFQSNSPSYKYFINTTGTWSSTASYKPYPALDSQQWDYVTLQQSSRVSGLPDTYDPYLTTMINIVKEHCPYAELAWHMTWAYQQNSTHNAFANYNNDQMTMYNAIIDATRVKILTNSNFTKVIPSGTAIQNLRTSFIGDTLTRDGYHLSKDLGRYVAALTFAKALTGCSLADVTYRPSEYTYTTRKINAMKQAANGACSHPYKVTESTYKTETISE